MMKKILTAVAVFMIILSLSACNTATDLIDDLNTAIDAEGRDYDNLITAKVGETTTNAFFEWTVSSVKAAFELDGYTPPDGYMYIIADIKTKNVSYDNDMSLGNYDFYIVWGAGDDEWDWSLLEFTDGMYPDEEYVEVGKGLEGMLVFLVPDDVEEVSIVFEEVYDDDFIGDIYSYDVVLADSLAELSLLPASVSV